MAGIRNVHLLAPSVTSGETSAKPGAFQIRTSTISKSISKHSDICDADNRFFKKQALAASPPRRRKHFSKKEITVPFGSFQSIFIRSKVAADPVDIIFTVDPLSTHCMLTLAKLSKPPQIANKERLPAGPSNAPVALRKDPDLLGYCHNCRVDYVDGKDAHMQEEYHLKTVTSVILLIY
jgi:hypothetical protein